MTWPSASTTVMLRATPTITAAGSRLCMPSRYAVGRAREAEAAGEARDRCRR